MVTKEKMKAIVCTKYGDPDVLQMQEVDKPSPKSNEVLIKIHAVPVIAADRRIRGCDIPSAFISVMFRLFVGFRKPRNPILGFYLAGEIVQIGKLVKKFQVGDEVLARTSMKAGAYAQYICLPEDGLMGKKPTNLSWEDAAAIPYGAINALFFLNKSDIKNKNIKNKKTLIYGGSGAIGTSAVQLSKYYGSEVTAVCSTANINLVKSIGADKVVDYTRENCKKLEDRFDLVFDAVGKITATESAHLLKENGKYVSSVFSGKSKAFLEDFSLVRKLSESGVLKPVIDKIYAWEDVVEAHRYADKWHVKGIVILKISH